MTTATTTPEPEEGPVCSWCGRRLIYREAERGSAPVCGKCLVLLRDAGLSDEEIFREESVSSDKE